MKIAFTIIEGLMFFISLVAFSADYSDQNALKLKKEIDKLPFSYEVLAFSDLLQKDTISLTRLKIDSEGLKRFEMVWHYGVVPFFTEQYYVRNGDIFSHVTGTPDNYILESYSYSIDPGEHLLNGEHLYNFDGELETVQNTSYQYEIDSSGVIRKMVVKNVNNYLQLEFVDEVYFDENGKDSIGYMFSRGKKTLETHYEYKSGLLYLRTVETFPLDVGRDYIAPDHSLNIFYYDQFGNVEKEELFKIIDGQHILQSKKVYTWLGKYLPVSMSSIDINSGKTEATYYKIVEIK